MKRLIFSIMIFASGVGLTLSPSAWAQAEVEIEESQTVESTDEQNIDMDQFNNPANDPNLLGLENEAHLSP